MIDFSLQSWNCFGLPQGAFKLLRGGGPPSAHRLQHPELHAALAAPDILCVQELWMKETLELFGQLPHPHKLRDESRMLLFPPTMVGKGLGIASRFAITRSTQRSFSRPHAGSDRLARKGMLHARIAVGDSPRVELDLINAHWQAQRGPAARRVRARQMRELAAFIDEVASPERAVFLCGDFNLDGLLPHRASEYDALRALLHDFEDLGARADQPTFHPSQNLLAQRFFAHEPDQRLDYIFFRPATRGSRIEVAGFEVAMNALLPAHGAHPASFSSDHFAVTARCRLVDGE